MIQTNNTERAEYLRRRISTIEWDMTLIRDEDTLKQRQLQLQLLRSELDGLKAKNN